MGEHGASPDLLAILGPLATLVGVAGYLRMVASARVRGRSWPTHRSVCWVTGSAAATIAVAGPIARSAHVSLPAHMVAHLLLGMVAPLLLVLAAPVTLVLRFLPVASARRLSRLLTLAPVRVLTEPVVAAVLNVGGLWLLYLSPLYAAMHHHAGLHLVVHLHLLVAGYLFTVSMISVDPLPHRRSHRHRAVVLVLALAAHDILAKYLYAHPPVGVGAEDAEFAAQVMYYGGDVVDLAVGVLLCAGWYRATRPRTGPLTLPSPAHTS